MPSWRNYSVYCILFCFLMKYCSVTFFVHAVKSSGLTKSYVCVFVGQSRSMSQANDFDGARRLGRRSLLFSIMAIAVGLTIILYLAITGKYTNTLAHK